MNRWLVVSIGLTLLSAAGSLVVWFGLYDRLAERVPTHWNARWEVDGWVARADALPHLLIVPGCMAGLVALTLVLPWLSPRHFEIAPFRTTYLFIMALVNGLLGWLHLLVLLAATEVPLDLERSMLGGMFVVLGLLGNVLGKVRRNFYVGIRTPWALASDRVWNETHRLGAWCFVLGAALGFTLAMFRAPLWLSMGAFGVPVLVPIVYSLVLYKRLERAGQLESE